MQVRCWTKEWSIIWQGEPPGYGGWIIFGNQKEPSTVIG
jgi:hypothetical protein